MSRIKKLLKYEKELICLGTFIFAIILVDLLLFNQGFVFSCLSRLEERHFSISSGTLYQFNIENGNLVAQNIDPNITFENIDIPIGYIAMNCTNFIPATIGKIYYRSKGEYYVEPHSISYDTSISNKTFALKTFLGFPKIIKITSLRFDLTDNSNDIISCSDFAINPRHIPYRLNIIHLSIYLGLLFFSILIIFRKISPISNIFNKIVSFVVKCKNSIKKNISDPINIKIELVTLDIQKYLKEHVYVIAVLAVIALTSYGFELFNLNISLDEEIFAFKSAPLEWVAQGRWGMYFLNKILLPYVVVPFVPLFIALIFQIGAVLLMMNCWSVKSKLEQIIIGAIGITFPSLAYIYTFSTLNYGVGIGFFCVSLSLFIFKKRIGWQKYLAIIPAAFAISIYQGFIFALVFVFLIYLIVIGLQAEKNFNKHMIQIPIILIMSGLTYLFIQKLLFIILKITLSGYITKQFDMENLFNNFSFIFSRFLDMMGKVYLGDKSIYSYKIVGIGTLLVLAILGLVASLFRSKSSFPNKVFIILFTLGIILLPFSSGFLMNGNYEIRYLVGLPIVFSGLIMLGMIDKSRTYKILIGILTLFCILQFVRSNNHLFASSFLALQSDRWTGYRLIERIEVAKEESESVEKIELKYMEIVGTLNLPETELLPHGLGSSTFGLSFFEWDQGNAARILLFLKTLGYQGLQPLPSDRRSQIVEIADEMPTWPQNGSVKVVGDTVLVKFGPYSNAQIYNICTFEVQKQNSDKFDINSCKSNYFLEK